MDYVVSSAATDELAPAGVVLFNLPGRHADPAIVKTAKVQISIESAEATQLSLKL